jgi:hypothetical protein
MHHAYLPVGRDMGTFFCEGRISNSHGNRDSALAEE